MAPALGVRPGRPVAMRCCGEMDGGSTARPNRGKAGVRRAVLLAGTRRNRDDFDKRHNVAEVIRIAGEERELCRQGGGRDE